MHPLISHSQISNLTNLITNSALDRIFAHSIETLVARSNRKEGEKSNHHYELCFNGSKSLFFSCPYRNNPLKTVCIWSIWQGGCSQGTSFFLSFQTHQWFLSIILHFWGHSNQSKERMNSAHQLFVIIPQSHPHINLVELSCQRWFSLAIIITSKV